MYPFGSYYSIIPCYIHLGYIIHHFFNFYLYFLIRIAYDNKGSIIWSPMIMEALLFKVLEEYKMELLHETLLQITEGAIFLFEFMGVLVLILTGLRGITNYFKKSPFTRLNLAQGMAMGLEFKLGSEILRTVVVREWTEVALVGGIILLRAALTLLIHWEITNEKKEISLEELEVMKKNQGHHE